MSPQLKEYIDSLPISTFLLANDRQLIGRKIAEEPHAIYINALCSIETIFEEDNSVRQFMMPLIPHSLEETSALFRSHVVVECPASLPLKKSYCDTLLQTKVNSLNSLSSLDLDTTNQNPKPQKPFGDRWKN